MTKHVNITNFIDFLETDVQYTLELNSSIKTIKMIFTANKSCNFINIIMMNKAHEVDKHYGRYAWCGVILIHIRHHFTTIAFTANRLCNFINTDRNSEMVEIGKYYEE